MSNINKDLLNNEEKQKLTTQASEDIANCLHGLSGELGENIILSAFLLLKTSQSALGKTISFNDILNGHLLLENEVLSKVHRDFTEVAWEQLKQLLSKYPEDVFYLVAMLPNHKSLKMITPHSIVKLAEAILNIAPNDTVADICCGSGTFLIAASQREPRAKYMGFEINWEEKMLASIRAELLGGDITIFRQDAFALMDESGDLPFAAPKFDKIFSNYPFRINLRNLKIGNKYLERLYDQHPELLKAKSSDWVFNALIYDLLKDHGKAVGIMTNGSTWNSGDTGMRKYFLERGMVECVISLPDRLFNMTALATSLIVLSHGNNAVRLIDASELCQKGRRANEFSAENIAQIIAAMDTDSDYSKLISMDELRMNDYALNCSRYLQEKIVFDYAVPFGSVIKSITRGAPCTASQLDDMVSKSATKMQYLMSVNIQDGIIDNKLPFLSSIDAQFEKYCLKNNDLILSKNGNPFKVAVASIEEEQRILVNGNLYIIALDEECANPYYIKAFFESELGVAVLNSIAVGNLMSTIGVDSLKNIAIPLPPLAEQEKVATKYRATMDEIVGLKLQLAEAISRLPRIFDEESQR